MTDDQLNAFVQKIRSILLQSRGLFGFVYELNPDTSAIAGGRPLTGTITDEATLRSYFKSTGGRIMEVRADLQNQSVTVMAPEDVSETSTSWFAVILTQGLAIPVCVAIFYRFYDEEEAIRTLRLVELILK